MYCGVFIYLEKQLNFTYLKIDVFILLQEVVWFELKSGEPQRCDCGNYFKLIKHDPIDPNIKAEFGRGFGSGYGSIYY